MGDDRYSYKGQLPFFKKAETWFSSDNPDQHGHDGPIHVASAGSTRRIFPLSTHAAAAWEQLGVRALPNLDQNAGDNLGRAYICEARKEGRRQFSAAAYPFGEVEVRTGALVSKVVLEKEDGKVVAKGVELAGEGGFLPAKNVVVSAGAVRSPQVLLLSGIGPAADLKERGIESVVDNPDVGKGLTDHMSFFQHWRVKDPSAGYTLGSPNPDFAQPQYAQGVPMDWIVSTGVSEEGLKEAIKKDEGVDPDPATHPLLKNARTFLEHVVLYAKVPLPGIPLDAEHLTSMVVNFLPTSRGKVSLKSTNPEDAPSSKYHQVPNRTQC